MGLKVLKGRPLEICSGLSGLDWNTVVKYRVMFAEQGYDLPPEPEKPKNYQPKPARFRELVGTALKSRIEKLITIKTGKGCDCQNLATQMDSWGIAGCERRRDEIVEHLVSNRDILSAAMRSSDGWLNHIGGLFVEVMPESTLRAGAGWLLSMAIEDVRNQPKPQQRVKRDAASLKSNTKLYEAMLAAPKPCVDPFDGEPVFHFGGHLWPIVGCWEQHVDTWNRLAQMITGRCFVGIAECEGCGTSPTSEVIARLSDRFEVFTVLNSKDGENPTFTELLTRIPQGNNDVFLYAHGKGVKPATRQSSAVKVWVSVMYETVIFNHHEITRRMAQGYKVFGSLRAFGDKPLSPRHNWHYAGTFFAVRAKHIPATAAVKSGYGGVEAWPGDNFPANEAWCEFGDHRNIMSHYSEKEMCSGAIEGAVSKLRSMYTDRYKHKNLIAVTTCNLYQSPKINEDIRVLLDSLFEHCISSVLVVDDGSPAEYQQYVHDLCRRRGFGFIPLPKNGGVASAKNVCLNWFLADSRYEYCFLLDDDVKVVSPEFETKYVSAMEQAGVGILSWNDPIYTGTKPESVGELVATDHTCGCCVVVARECVEATGLYTVMPGKWGREHSEYYRRAAKSAVYLDVAGSSELIQLVSDASVFTHEEKLESNELNRLYLEGI